MLIESKSSRSGVINESETSIEDIDYEGISQKIKGLLLILFNGNSSAAMIF